MKAAQERGVPLDAIDLSRLGLSDYERGALQAAGLETVRELATQLYERWHHKAGIILELNRYLAWLLEQSPDVWSDEVAGRGISPLHQWRLQSATLENLWQGWIAGLGPRQRQVVCWRQGHEGQVLTFDEIGARLQLSRQRAHQIYQRSLKALASRTKRDPWRSLNAWLIRRLQEAGEPVSTHELVHDLRLVMTLGDIRADRVVDLLLSLHEQAKRTKTGWTLADHA